MKYRRMERLTAASRIKTNLYTAAAAAPCVILWVGYFVALGVSA